MPLSSPATSATLVTGDIEIGAVEVKDGVADIRQTVLAASTAAQATDKPSVVALHPSSIGKVSIDQTTPGTTDSVSFKSAAAVKSVTFTPANSSHAAGDCVGAAQNFTSLGISAKPIMITGASLLINTGTAQVTTWRLHLYNVTPPSATADDGVWDLPSGDQASYLGYIDLGTAVDMGSTQWVEINGINKEVLLAGTGLFAYLTNGTTATLLAVSHIVTLTTVQL